MFLIFIVSTVLAHAVVEVDALTDTGVVNIAVLDAAVMLILMFLMKLINLGWVAWLPGPGLCRKIFASEFCFNFRKLLLMSAGKEAIHGPAQSVV